MVIFRDSEHGHHVLQKNISDVGSAMNSLRGG
jgi:hypothetical protein